MMLSLSQTHAEAAPSQAILALSIAGKPEVSGGFAKLFSSRFLTETSDETAPFAVTGTDGKTGNQSGKDLPPLPDVPPAAEYFPGSEVPSGSLPIEIPGVQPAAPDLASEGTEPVATPSSGRGAHAKSVMPPVTITADRLTLPHSSNAPETIRTDADTLPLETRASVEATTKPEARQLAPIPTRNGTGEGSQVPANPSLAILAAKGMVPSDRAEPGTRPATGHINSAAQAAANRPQPDDISGDKPLPEFPQAASEKGETASLPGRTRTENRGPVPNNAAQTTAPSGQEQIAIPADGKATLVATHHASAFQPTHRLDGPQDFSALVDRLVEAREAAGGQTVKAAFQHDEFGKISIQFRAETSRLGVTMTSADPDFAPAAQAAAVVAQAQASSPQGDATQNGTRHDAHGQNPATSGTGQGQTNLQSNADANPHGGQRPEQEKATTPGTRKPASESGQEAREPDTAQDTRGGIYA